MISIGGYTLSVIDGKVFVSFPSGESGVFTTEQVTEALDILYDRYF